MNDLKHALLLLLAFVLVACERKPVSPCPLVGPEFWESAIHRYFEDRPPRSRVASVTILEDARYNYSPPGWMVSVEVPDYKYIAWVSCDGHVELSGRELSSL